MANGENGNFVEVEEEVYWRDKAVRHRLGFALENDTVFTDVVFIVGKEEIRVPAHKLILRLSSLVFENLITSHEEQGLSEIRLPNSSPSMFKRMLKFIYTDELEMYDFIKFLRVARDFGFQKLAVQSVETLKKTNITSSNAVFLLDIAKGLGDSELEESSLSYVLQNAEAVLSSKTFLLMSYVSLCQVLLEDRLSCDELTLFKSVLRWAKFQCRRSNTPETGENIRNILKDARLFIRYTSMKYDQFIQEVKPSEILDSKEYVKVLKLFVDLTSNPLNIQTRRRNFQAGDTKKAESTDVSFSRRNDQLSLAPLPVSAKIVQTESYGNSVANNYYEYAQPITQEYLAPSQMQIRQMTEPQPVRPEPTDKSEFQLKNCSVDFTDLVNAVKLQYTIKKIILHEVILQNAILGDGRRVFLPNLQVFHYFQQKDLSCKLPDKSFMNGLTTKDLLFFEKRQGGQPWMFNELWGLGVEICINVKGLRLMEINPQEEKLVLAYPDQSEADLILRGLLKQTNVKNVCLTACVVRSIICQIPTRRWEKLVLQGVIFETCKVQIFNKCTSLKYLSVFSSDGTPINLVDDLKLQRNTLLRLSLSKANIGGWGNRKALVVPFSALEELYLDVCFWDHGFKDRIHQIFPNLKRIAIRSKDECRVCAHLMANILEIKSLEKITIFRYPGGEDTHYNQNIDLLSVPYTSEKVAVKRFLQKSGMEFPDNFVTDFILTKKQSSPPVWKAIWDESDLDEIHFQYSMLNEFFVDSSASKIIE